MSEYLDDRSDAVRILKNKLGEEWETIVKTKEKLDQINFVGLYRQDECYDADLKMYLPRRRTRNKNWSILEPLDAIDSKTDVAQMYDKASKHLPLNKNIQLGTVSNGVHATELIERYFTPDMVRSIDYWCTKKVMVVYEAPANNLDCCHALMNECDNAKKNAVPQLIKKYIEENHDKARPLKDNLTNRWWRLDEPLLRQCINDDAKCEINKQCHACYECFMNKSYTGFLLALISCFGLANLYTTNYCRIELYDYSEEKESYLGWGETLEHCNDVFNAEEELFIKEYTEYSPDVILATANPYNWMTQGNNTKVDSSKIIKIIHPASRYPRSLRFCYNMCTITSELEEYKVIGHERANVVFQQFRNILRAIKDD